MGGSGTEAASEDVDPVAVAIPVLVLAARVVSVTCTVGGEVLGDAVVVRVESGGRSREAVVEGGGQLVEAVLVV